MRAKILLTITLFSLLILSNLLHVQTSYGPAKLIFKPSINNSSKYTIIGNFGLTSTNFEMMRDNFVIQIFEDKPRCEYHNSIRIKHMFDGGLRVTGVRDVYGDEWGNECYRFIQHYVHFEFINSIKANSLSIYFETNIKNA